MVKRAHKLHGNQLYRHAQPFTAWLASPVTLDALHAAHISPSQLPLKCTTAHMQIQTCSCPCFFTTHVNALTHTQYQNQLFTHLHDTWLQTRCPSMSSCLVAGSFSTHAQNTASTLTAALGSAHANDLDTHSLSVSNPFARTAFTRSPPMQKLLLQ